MRQVTLVVGAPCSGKSTFVAENASADDVIVDWNDLAVELGSPVLHDHDTRFMAATNAARKRLEDEVAQATDITAWVIRTVPNPRDRSGIMQRLRATDLVIVDPGMDVCLERARNMGRPVDIDATILKWYGLKYGARNYAMTTGWHAGRKPATDPRHTADWKRVSEVVRRNGGPCAICGNPIRYDKRKPDPLSFSVDHIIAVTQGGAWFDLANLQPAHYGCNSSKGNRTAANTHRTSEAY